MTETQTPLHKTGRMQRVLPALRYELITCGFHGHVLIGTNVRQVRPEDDLVVRQDSRSLRWCRCLRCDSWLPFQAPAAPECEHLPPLEEIRLPLRGETLRKRYVLRLIAIERLVHFLLLGLLAAGVLLFAKDQSIVDDYWFQALHDFQSGFSGLSLNTTSGVLGLLNRLVTVQFSSVLLTGLVLVGYSLLAGAEAAGLWFGRRWAEYLTLVATTGLLVPEILELIESITLLKVIALLANLTVMAYLLVAKRLFGIRGGGQTEATEREHDSGWAALRRNFPDIAGADTGRTASEVAVLSGRGANA